MTYPEYTVLIRTLHNRPGNTHRLSPTPPALADRKNRNRSSGGALLKRSTRDCRRLEVVPPSNRRKPQAIRSARRPRTSRAEVKLDVITTCRVVASERKRRGCWSASGDMVEEWGGVRERCSGGMWWDCRCGGGWWRSLVLKDGSESYPVLMGASVEEHVVLTQILR